MNNLKEIFVIVEQFESPRSLFTNFVSTNKEEIKLKCEELNKEANDNFLRDSKKNNLPFIPLTIFIVLNLEEAIELLNDKCFEYYSEKDESC